MPEDKPDLRAERLKAALRANLRRRKAQERGRTAPDSSSPKGDDTPQIHPDQGEDDRASPATDAR